MRPSARPSFALLVLTFTTLTAPLAFADEEQRQKPDEVIVYEATPDASNTSAVAPEEATPVEVEPITDTPVTVTEEKLPLRQQNFDLTLGSAAPEPAAIPLLSPSRPRLRPTSLIERSVPAGSGVGVGTYVNTAGGAGFRLEGKMGFGLNLIVGQKKDDAYRTSWSKTLSLVRLNPGIKASVDVGSDGKVDRESLEVSIGSIGHFALVSSDDEYGYNDAGELVLVKAKPGETITADVLPVDYIRRSDKILGNEVEGIAVGIPISNVARLVIDEPASDQWGLCAHVTPVQLVIGKISLNGGKTAEDRNDISMRMLADLCGRYRLGHGRGEIVDTVSLEALEGTEAHSTRTFKNDLEWKNVMGSPVNAHYTWSLDQNIGEELNDERHNQVHAVSVHADF